MLSPNISLKLLVGGLLLLVPVFMPRDLLELPLPMLRLGAGAGFAGAAIGAAGLYFWFMDRLTIRSYQLGMDQSVRDYGINGLNSADALRDMHRRINRNTALVTISGIATAMPFAFLAMTLVKRLAA